MMRQHLIHKICLLLIVIFCASCGQAQHQEENTAATAGLKMIEPTIGNTPDISTDAKKNLERVKILFAKIDSVINSYPDYETAKLHLSEKQIAIFENEEDYGREDHLDVGSTGCSWYCGGGPDSIYSSSVLKPTKTLDYKPENAHDFSLRTAWVEGANGMGTGENITYRFARMSPPVTTVEIYNGYMKSEQVWQDNARVKQLKLYVNDKPYAILNLKDIKSKQIFAIDTLQGKDSDLFLKFEIVDVYKGDKYEDVAISEIEFDGIGVHCFAKGTMISTPTGQAAIEELAEGDTVLSYNEITGKVEPAKIVALASQKHHNLYELDFSGTMITVTDDHPFFYQGQFYSIEKNNQYGQSTLSLLPGQKIQFLQDGLVQERVLSTIKKAPGCSPTYTITKLDRNKLFYANGACVMTEGRGSDEL